MQDKRAHFEKIAQDWDAMQSPERPQDVRVLLSSHLPLFRQSKRILEIGTGTGLLISMLQTLAPQAYLLSVDLAHAMLLCARVKHPQASLLQADACHLPFARDNHLETKFDLIMCHNTFPHFQDPLQALASINQSLRPGGHVLILHDRSRRTVNALHHRIGGAIGADLLPAPKDLQALIEQAGLVCLEIEDGPEYFQALARRPQR